MLKRTLRSPIDVHFWDLASRYALAGLLVLVAGSCSSFAALGQEGAAEPVPGEGTVRIVLLDGTVLVGTVEAVEDESIVLINRSGVRMEIPRAQVRSVRVVESLRFDRVDPNATRLLFAPTARSLAPGTGYVSVYEIFVPFVAVGVPRSVTLAGGVTINPGTDRLGYVAPKVTLLERSSLSVAVGTLLMTAFTEDAFGGIVYGVGTYGRREAALTAGLGFAFSNETFEESPLLLIGGEYQLSSSVKLISENYVLPAIEEGVLVSAGVRFFGDQLAAEIGLLTVPTLLDEMDGFPFVPWLGFAYNFSP